MTVTALAPLLAIPTSRLRLQFRARKTWRIRAMEPAFRGRLGMVLHRAFCQFPEAPCPECTLAAECGYPALFAPLPPPPAIPQNGPPRVPATPVRPFVPAFDAPPDHPALAPGQTAGLSLTLFGPAAASAGIMGEAAAQALHTFGLDVLEAGLMLPVFADGTAPNQPSPPLADWVSAPADPPSQIALRLETPLRLTRKDRIVREDLSFEMLVKALIRRLRDLKRSFGDDADMGRTNDKFFQAVRAIRVTENRLRWQRRTRSSARQETEVFLDGFMGDIHFSGDLAPFLPLLRAAEIIHLGKGTSSGNGRIRLTPGR